MTTVTVERVIRVDVIASANAAKNIDMVAQGLKKIEDNSDRMRSKLETGFSGFEATLQRTTSFLTAFGATFGAGQIARGILEMSSAYEILTERLRVVLGNYDAANKAQNQIVDIAIRTGKDMDGTSKLYEKAARAAKQFGYDTNIAGKITEAFSNSIRLSGSSTQEAYAAMVQFGQALASGRLQGDEFRSLMENNSVFMYEFAAAAGKSVTELRKLGSEGKLSSDFLFDTMLKKGEDGLTLLERLNKMAGDVPLTFRQSAQSLGTATTQLVGEMVRAIEASSKDELGVFGPIIRSLRNLTKQFQDLNTVTSATDPAWWERLWEVFKLVNKNAPMPWTLPGQTAMDMFMPDRSPGEQIAARLSKARQDLDVAEKQLQAARSSRVGEYESDVDPVAIRNAEARVALLRTQVDRMESGLRKIERGVMFDDEYYTKSSAPRQKSASEPSKELRSARDALDSFVKKMQEEVAVEEALRAEKERTKDAVQDLVRLDLLAKEAQIPLNSARLEEVRTLIARRDAMKTSREEAERFRRDQARDALESANEIKKYEELIRRDEASMEALSSRRRSTQEYSTESLQRGIESTVDRIEALSVFGGSGAFDPALQRAYDLLDVLQRALKTRRELEGKQDSKRIAEEQRRIDAEKIKEQDQLAGQINEQLKKNIINGKGGGSIGEQLLRNIRDTFRGKAIDIVINPVTSIISRVLAQLADQFSASISRAIFEAIASRSSDPIGSFIGMKGLAPTGGFDLGGTLMSGISKLFSWFPFADGLSYVPYDGYKAELHRGERVLTAQENKQYRESSSGGRNVTVTSAPVINIDARSDAGAVRQQVNDAIRRNNKVLLEELNAQGVL